MPTSLYLLTLTAGSIAFTHTVMGPDHYLPFIMMARAGSWSRLKTYLVTFLCGVGHVLSSILIGVVGIALGVGVTRLEGIESTRGGLAAWALIGFGLLYGAWGLRRALRGKTHSHRHAHENGSVHKHEHAHANKHAHAHGSDAKLTPWVLFTVFVLGPCEPLIPLLMYPAAKHSLWGIAAVTTVFAVVTIAVMLVVVALGLRGVSLARGAWVERFSHSIAGFVIAGSGLAIQFLGL